MLDEREGEEEHEVREVLLVEDNLIDAQLIRRLLRRVSAAYYRITHVRTLNDAILSAEELTPDVILADLNLPDSRGTQTVTSLQTSYPDIPLVIVSAWEDEAISLRSVKAGAQDYLVKGHIDAHLLVRSILYAMKRKRIESRLRGLALLDEKTGIYTQTAFFALAKYNLRLAERTRKGFLYGMATVEGLDNIIETFGPQEGEQAVMDAARILRRTLGEDHIV